MREPLPKPVVKKAHCLGIILLVMQERPIFRKNIPKIATSQSIANLNASSSYGDKLKVLSGYDFEIENYGVALRKGETALLAKLNETIEELYNNGTTGDIASRYGLNNDLVKPETYTKFDEVEDKSSWEYIKNKGNIIIGYTVFAPIAFEA